ncbi:MAG: hypothetical protein RJS98_00035, partial [Rhodospirillaceae bacterium]
AVTAFADPHAKFGLQFHVEFEDDDDTSDMDEDDYDEDDDFDVAPIDSAAVTQKLKANRKARKETADSEDQEAATDEDESGKVVTLDAFRKK